MALPEIDEAVAAYERGDYAAARKTFERATAAGDPVAARYLGFMYQFGHGVTQNNRQALTYFRRAADTGDLEAQVNLARLYEAGIGLRQNYPAAAEWYRRAADQGDAGAMIRLAMLRRDGRDSPADLSEAALWYRRAAELGNSEAQGIVAHLYAEGSGVERDPVEGLLWASLAAATDDAAAALRNRLAGEMSETARAEACYRLAMKSSAPDTAATDEARAAENFKLAAELGHPEAMRRVGAIERTLAAPSIAAEPMTPPGGLSAIAEDRPVKAPADRTPTSAAGDPFNEPATDKKTEPVIETGPSDALAQAALGLDFYFGRNGRPRDLAAAAKWLQRAADGGSRAAQHDLSVMYAHGEGLQPDPTEGARWCRIAAERGDRRSQFRMSHLYLHGQGVDQDAVEALYWAELAARQGHKGALAKRDVLAARMTAQQIADVRHRAENFQRKS
jgi:TPR repeat protein